VTPDRREFPKASLEFLERRLADLDRLNSETAECFTFDRL
jgi:hypothetical protein